MCVNKKYPLTYFMGLTRVDLIELVALEVEVLLHSTDVGIVEVHAVEIIDPVHQTAKGQDDEVNLDEERALRLGGCGLAPDHLSDF